MRVCVNIMNSMTSKSQFLEFLGCQVNTEIRVIVAKCFFLPFKKKEQITKANYGKPNIVKHPQITVCYGCYLYHPHMLALWNPGLKISCIFQPHHPRSDLLPNTSALLYHPHFIHPYPTNIIHPPMSAHIISGPIILIH